MLQATGDPYYLRVGQSIVEKLNAYTRVPCGFAAVQDVRTGAHEDRCGVRDSEIHPSSSLLKCFNSLGLSLCIHIDLCVQDGLLLPGRDV